MSKFDNSFPPYSVAPGEQTSGTSNPVNAEQLGLGKFSQRIAIADKGNGTIRPVTMTFTYATVPASVQYDIYAAWDDLTPPAVWTKIGTTSNVNGDQVTIQRGAAGGPNFRFLCVQEVISPGVNAMVQVRQ